MAGTARGGRPCCCMRILTIDNNCEAVSLAAFTNPGLAGFGPASTITFCSLCATSPPFPHISLSVGGKAKGPMVSKASTAA